MSSPADDYSSDPSTPCFSDLRHCDSSGSLVARDASITCRSDREQRDRDAEDAQNFQNPEPAKELVEQNLIDADNIGDTVFSKHWLFTTLMKLLKVVEEADNSSSNVDETPTAALCVELDDNLQDDLCKLWDMSMNQEVVNFLLEFKAIDLLMVVITKSKASRATEICVGILGNMACVSAVCKQMGDNKKLVELLLFLLQSTDSPTLVETMRLLHACVSSEDASPWIAAVNESSQVVDSFHFILQSSTNRDLLKKTADLIDKLMESDEDICTQWSSPNMVLSVMEAIKQIGILDNKFGCSSDTSDVLDTFLHILQLVSTSESGVQALVCYAGEVCVLVNSYLMDICSDDIVGVEGRENVLGSTLSILRVIFTQWEGHQELLSSDFQVIRCILKIFDVVYPKHKKLPRTRVTTRQRSESSAASIAASYRDKNGSTKSSDKNHIDDTTHSDRIVSDAIGGHILQLSTTQKLPKDENIGENDSRELSDTNATHSIATEEFDASKQNGDGNDNVKLINGKLVIINKTHRTRIPSYAGDGDDIALLSATSTVCERRQSSEERAIEQENEAVEDYADEMITTLFEVIQDLLAQIVLAVLQIPIIAKSISSTERDGTANSQSADAEGEIDKDCDTRTVVPITLNYLDSMCDRGRLQFMLLALHDTEDAGLIKKLYAVGQSHGLKRLCRIIDDTIPSAEHW